MAPEAFGNVFRGFHQYTRAFVHGALTRFQKLKWQGKLVVMALVLFNISLVTVFIVIGPDAIFQVHTIAIAYSDAEKTLVSISSVPEAEECSFWLANLRLANGFVLIISHYGSLFICICSFGLVSTHDWILYHGKLVYVDSCGHVLTFH